MAVNCISNKSVGVLRLDDNSSLAGRLRLFKAVGDSETSPG